MSETPVATVVLAPFRAVAIATKWAAILAIGVALFWVALWGGVYLLSLVASLSSGHPAAG